MLLSICIPTYNRAVFLGPLLDFWISEMSSLSVEDREQCEIFVRDNASSDNTSEVVLCRSFKYNYIHYNRNDENIGAEPNFGKVTYDAHGKYVWWIGDDDEYIPGILNKVVSSLKEIQPALLYINNCGMPQKNSTPDYEYAISADFPSFFEDGKDAIVEIAKCRHVGTILYMSSKVILRELLLESILYIKVPNGSFPLHAALYAGSKGSVAIIKDLMIKNIYGTISWSDRADKIHFEEIPETIKRIGEWNYSETQIVSLLDSYYIPSLKEGNRIYQLKKLKETNIIKYLFVGGVDKINRLLGIKNVR